MKLNINLTAQSIICAVLVMAAIVGLCAIFSFAFELKFEHVYEPVECADLEVHFAVGDKPARYEIVCRRFLFGAGDFERTAAQ